MQHFLIKSIQMIHFGFIIFVLLGWLLPGATATILYLAVCVAMILQWLFNHGTCLLTNFENMLKGHSWVDRKEHEVRFVESFVNRYYKGKLHTGALDFVLYGIVYSLMALNTILFCLF